MNDAQRITDKIQSYSPPKDGTRGFVGRRLSFNKGYNNNDDDEDYLACKTLTCNTDMKVSGS